MAIDERDWHKDHHNKRTGYVERSTFRIGHAEEQRRKYRAAWRRNLVEAGWWAATVLSVWYLWNR